MPASVQPIDQSYSNSNSAQHIEKEATASSSSHNRHTKSSAVSIDYNVFMFLTSFAISGSE